MTHPAAPDSHPPTCICAAEGRSSPSASSCTQPVAPGAAAAAAAADTDADAADAADDAGCIVCICSAAVASPGECRKAEHSVCAPCLLIEPSVYSRHPSRQYTAVNRAVSI